MLEGPGTLGSMEVPCCAPFSDYRSFSRLRFGGGAKMPRQPRNLPLSLTGHGGGCTVHINSWQTFDVVLVGKKGDHKRTDRV